MSGGAKLQRERDNKLDSGFDNVIIMIMIMIFMIPTMIIMIIIGEVEMS